MVYNRSCYPNRTYYYPKSGETEGSESRTCSEPERYAVEARIFNIGMVITKVRLAEHWEKTRRLETKNGVIWIDVFNSREEAEEFRKQYHEPWEGKEKNDYESD